MARPNPRPTTELRKIIRDPTLFFWGSGWYSVRDSTVDRMLVLLDKLDARELRERRSKPRKAVKKAVKKPTKKARR